VPTASVAWNVAETTKGEILSAYENQQDTASHRNRGERKGSTKNVSPVMVSDDEFRQMRSKPRERRENRMNDGLMRPMHWACPVVHNDDSEGD